MKQNKLIITLILILSFGILISGCTTVTNINTNNTYIIEGTVSLDQGTVEDVILKIEDNQGITTINPDSNGQWNAIISQGNVSVKPRYDRDSDGSNDYAFRPSIWSDYVNKDIYNIDFTGTYGASSYSAVQEMLGEWEFSYTIASTDYIEYYVFDELRQDSETGKYYAYGYKEGEYSSSSGYRSYNNETSVATYYDKEDMYTVLWLSELKERYGSYFEFSFTSTDEVSGYFYLISDGELASADPMNGTRTTTNISTLNIKNMISTSSYDDLIEELKQKQNESNMISEQASSIDANEKIKIKENALEVQSK